MPTIDEANRITYCNIQWYMIFDHCNCLGYTLDTDCRTKLKAQKRRFMLRKYGNRPFWAKKQIFGNSVFSKSTFRPIPKGELCRDQHPGRPAQGPDGHPAPQQPHRVGPQGHQGRPQPRPQEV